MDPGFLKARFSRKSIEAKESYFIRDVVPSLLWGGGGGNDD